MEHKQEQYKVYAVTFITSFASSSLYFALVSYTIYVEKERAYCSKSNSKF